MVLGVGIDTVEVARVAEKIQKENGFREFVFAQEEIAYCEPKPHKYQHYAARFAAKEAFFKALGTGWANDTAFNEVIILGNELGKPELHLKGMTAEVLKISVNKIKVSISHVKEMAIAIVIIEA